MQAQDGQELLETLREIAEVRGDEIQVRLDVGTNPKHGPLHLILDLVEINIQEGRPMRGAPWVLELKENPAAGVTLEITSAAADTE